LGGWHNVSGLSFVRPSALCELDNPENVGLAISETRCPWARTDLEFRALKLYPAPTFLTHRNHLEALALRDTKR
jgi:hypothetical protein